MGRMLRLAPAGQNQDIELVDQARAGDRGAFDVLFQRHKQTVFDVCLGILGSREDAIDATQSTFIQAYRCIATFRGESSFLTWVYRIAVNMSVNAARKKKRRPECALDVDVPAPESPCNDRVWEAIGKLSPDFRAVIVLSYFHELSGRELAEALGCSEGNARTRLHRARQAFKKQYEEVCK